MTTSRCCATDADTQRAGQSFARILRSGDIVLLTGPLGAGKTTFAKGVAQGLGVTERVTSPTFAMVREHRCENDLGIQTLQHCDVYRVESLDEVQHLVEWGELAESVFGREVLRVSFEIDEDDTRTLLVGGAIDEARRALLEQWADQ